MNNSTKTAVKMRTRQSVNDANSPKRAQSEEVNRLNENLPKSNELSSPVDPIPPSDKATELTSSSSDSDKINFIFNEIHRLSDLCEEIKELKRLNKQKDEQIQVLENRLEVLEQKDIRVQELENRVEALEQYSRQDNLIISGFVPRHRTYAAMANKDQITENDEHAPEIEKTNLEDQLVTFLQEREIPIEKHNISTCHTLPSKSKSRPKPIVIRMTTRKGKIDVLRNSKKLKDSNVYVNEHLTTKNAAIATFARNLRKKERSSVHGYGTVRYSSKQQ